jgi:hypothetical protein
MSMCADTGSLPEYVAAGQPVEPAYAPLRAHLAAARSAGRGRAPRRGGGRCGVGL